MTVSDRRQEFLSCQINPEILETKKKDLEFFSFYIYRIIWSRELDLCIALWGIDLSSGRMYVSKVSFDLVDSDLVNKFEFYYLLYGLELDLYDFNEKQVIFAYKKKRRIVLQFSEPELLPVEMTDYKRWFRCNK